MKLKVATEQNGEVLIIEPKGALVGGEVHEFDGNRRAGIGSYFVRKSKRENRVVQRQQEHQKHFRCHETFHDFPGRRDSP